MFVDEADLDWQDIGPDHTGFRRKQLGRAAGGEGLGCSLYELPAGERAWPYHYHLENEEAIYVLDGTGRLRVGEDHHPLAPGTYVALPTGAAGGHRVVNDSEGPLRYLVVSTMDEPDVLGYPDADALGVYAGTPPGGDESQRVLSGFFREADAVDFWTDVAEADRGLASDGTNGRSLPVDDSNAMATDTTIDGGMDVMDTNGEEIGTVATVEDGVAYVDLDPGLTDEVKSSLGFGDTGDDTYPLHDEMIERVDEDAVHLRGDH